jgi:hypothetical protein
MVTIEASLVQLMICATLLGVLAVAAWVLAGLLLDVFR